MNAQTADPEITYLHDAVSYVIGSYWHMQLAVDKGDVLKEPRFEFGT